MGKVDIFGLVDDGEIDTLRTILLGGSSLDLNSLDQYGNSLLSHAVLCEDLEMVKLICAAGIDIHNCDLNKGGEPALMYALDSGNDAIISELILQCGGDYSGVSTWLGIPLEERVRVYEASKIERLG